MAEVEIEVTKEMPGNKAGIRISCKWNQKQVSERNKMKLLEKKKDEKESD